LRYLLTFRKVNCTGEQVRREYGELTLIYIEKVIGIEVEQGYRSVGRHCTGLLVCLPDARKVFCPDVPGVVEHRRADRLLEGPDPGGGEPQA